MERKLNNHQAIQKGWEERVFKEERTITGRFKKLQEEVGEVFAPLNQKTPEELTVDEKRAIAEELVDMIIVGLGCIDSLGYDFDNLFFEKMDRNWRKYNPSIIDELVSQGMTREEAVKEAKARWNRGEFLDLLVK